MNKNEVELNKWELRMAFRHYCMENKLCYCASNSQYDKMAIIFSEDIPEKEDYVSAFDSLASMLWICSNSDKSIKELSKELWDLFFNTIQ